MLAMDWQGVLSGQPLQWIISGFLTTLWVTLAGIVLATLIAISLLGLRLTGNRLAKAMVGVWVSVFRNTPLLIQLFFWYFAASQFLPASWIPWLNTPHEISVFGLTLNWPSFEFLAGFIGLTLYSTAFIAEELRSGISGVAKGQKYAAHALGLTGWQAMRHVVLPQALKIAMPPLLGQYMNIIKNSSLAMAIGVAELSYASRQVETETLRTFQAFGVATVLYIAIIALIEAWGMWRQQRTAAIKGH